MAIVYEDHVDVTVYGVRAFPTHILFVRGAETNRVEGANIPAVQQMIEENNVAAAAEMSFRGTGAALGGGSSGGAGAAVSAAEARAARLAKLGGGGSGAATTNTSQKEKEADAMQVETMTESKQQPATSEQPKTGDDAADVEMKDDETSSPAQPAQIEVDATANNNLDPQAIQTLTEEMGFTLLRAQKGLLYGNGSTVESAVEWLMQHQEDDDIDEPLPKATTTTNETAGAGGQVAQSYRCNDCGKILSNMANLELHANKTGHSDFEESTEHVKPLTADEKAKKIAEIKELLKAKRAEREETEKEDELEKEKQRRFMGKEMTKTREQLEIEQRKREAALRRKEKEDFKRERARLRAELEKDKAERKSRGGKLSSKLGVEGYNPDAIQYDVEMEGGGGDAAAGAALLPHKKKPKGDASKIDEYIEKISSYKAGGDGGKCLKILKAYVGNVVDNPDEEKFKTINMENKVFKTKVKPFIGARPLLRAVGFQQPEGDETKMVLTEDPDLKLMAETKEKLERASVAFG